MNESNFDESAKHREAFIAWGVFILLNILLNGTIPFLLGRDVSAWTASSLKDILFNFIQYSVMFLVITLILTKGRNVIRHPSFLVPLLLIIVAIAFRTYLRPVCAISVLLFAWLHFRHDLSDRGGKESLRERAVTTPSAILKAQDYK